MEKAANRASPRDTKSRKNARASISKPLEAESKVVFETMKMISLISN